VTSRPTSAQHLRALYGVRDCAFRDPAGNLIHIQEMIDG
jgi:hypothetical protein